MTVDRRNSRRILVKDFQRRFLLVNIFFFCLIAVTFVVALFGPLVVTLFNPSSSRDELAAIATAFLVLHGRIWLAIGLVMIASVVHLAVVSHRVAGPLVRLCRIFRQAGRGDVSMRVRVRTKDYLQEEAAALDDMMLGLRRRVSVAKGRLTRVEAALAKAQSTSAKGTTGEAGSALCDLEREVQRLRRMLDTFRVVPTTAAKEHTSGDGRPNGFTLVEMIIAMGIVLTLAGIGAPLYAEALNRARVVRATVDIRSIGLDILTYELTNNQLPDTLSQAGATTLIDPWGTPYQYLRIRGGKNGKGAVRKDHKLNPINSDFDLYSMGRDRVTKTQISNKDSLDDVIRANDGGYVGPASEY
jgi:general secretion pathway protein G